MRANRKEGRLQIYLDETWLNSHAAQERLWVDVDGSGGWRRPSGKGQRLIILNAGRSTGWIPRADIVLRTKGKTADYHDEMNSAHFIEWLEKQLLPNIPPYSLIILDNASYHNCVEEKTHYEVQEA